MNLIVAVAIVLLKLYVAAGISWRILCFANTLLGSCIFHLCGSRCKSFSWFAFNMIGHSADDAIQMMKCMIFSSRLLSQTGVHPSGINSLIYVVIIFIYFSFCNQSILPY